MKKLMLILTIATVLFSCAKDGKDGANGPAGADGSAGADGNANVLSTMNFNATSGNWTASNSYYYVNLIVPNIDAGIVNTGAVFVYYDLGNGSWAALPYIFGNLGRTFSFSLQEVRIRYQNIDGTQTTNPGNRTFRVVVIPSSNIIVDLDHSDYNSVKEAYSL